MKPQLVAELGNVCVDRLDTSDEIKLKFLDAYVDGLKSEMPIDSLVLVSAYLLLNRMSR